MANFPDGSAIGYGMISLSIVGFCEDKFWANTSIICIVDSYLNDIILGSLTFRKHSDNKGFLTPFASGNSLNIFDKRFRIER